MKVDNRSGVRDTNFMVKFLPLGPIVAVVTALAAAAPRGVCGQNPSSMADRPASPTAEVQQRLRELDSPCYETRFQAAQRLENWLSMPEMAALLADQFQRLLVEPELSYEVRWRLQAWRSRLPSARFEPPREVSGQELQHLVHQLDDGSYAVRAALPNGYSGWPPASGWRGRSSWP